MSMTVNDLIKQRGGAEKISAASQGTDAPVTPDAVHKWRKNGIPEVHWPIFISVGFGVEEIYAANELLRRKKSSASELVAKRSSSRVAA